MTFYCPEHKYNSPANSGLALCPECEIASDEIPLCLGCHADAQLDSDGYCSDCNDEMDEL